MTAKQLRCAIAGVVIAIVVTLLFNISYFTTFWLINKPDYAFNIGCLSMVIVLTGVGLDIIRSINFKRVTKEPQPNDLKPQGFKPPVYPDVSLTDLNNEQRVQKLEQIKKEETFTEEQKELNQFDRRSRDKKVRDYMSYPELIKDIDK